MGTATSALANGGWTGSVSGLNESLNGTSWTEVADLNTARQQASAGGESNTSAVIYAGYTATARTGITETWNGTSFTEDGDMSTARAYGQGGAGTATSALAFGGEDPSARTAATEEWAAAGVAVNAWSTGTNTNTPAVANRGHGTQGTQTAALATGGGNPVIANVESYDGTSWTEIADLNVAKHLHISIGTNTATLVAGGNTGSAIATNESWDGSSWTEVGDMNTARSTGTGTGTATAGLAVGGTPSPTKANCEIWDG